MEETPPPSWVFADSHLRAIAKATPAANIYIQLKKEKTDRNYTCVENRAVALVMVCIFKNSCRGVWVLFHCF
jgi:hypothetical protein